MLGNAEPSAACICAANANGKKGGLVAVFKNSGQDGVVQYWPNVSRDKPVTPSPPNSFRVVFLGVFYVDKLDDADGGIDIILLRTAVLPYFITPRNSRSPHSFNVQCMLTCAIPMTSRIEYIVGYTIPMTSRTHFLQARRD